MEFDDDVEEDPDQLRPIAAITFLDEWGNAAQDEVAQKIGMDMKDSYPALMIWTLQLEVHAVDYPDILAEYRKKVDALDNEYGNAFERLYELTSDEAIKRRDCVLFLSRNLGTMMIDSKFAHREQQTIDWIDFSKDWEKTDS